LPAEKPDVENKAQKDLNLNSLESVKPENFNSVISRLCQTESTILTLREGKLIYLRVFFC